MANPFYTYSGAFIPGTLARAEQVGAEYSSVQAGFALLAVQGTDAGSANTYVATTNSLRSAYADGNIVEFKAATSNTGASTINVDGIGVVGLTDFQGVSLVGGAIIANTWYRCIYNSTYSAWTLIAPSSTVITSNTISAAAPTNKVGLTAAGGVTTACAPIDATYALDQAIVPTWTGAHTFSNAVTFNSTVSFSGGLSLTGAANQYAATLTGSPTSGQSKGLLVKAGTNASDYAARIQNQSGATDYLAVLGEGSVTVGTPTGGGKGVGTINAQNLYVQGAAVLTTGVSSANPSATIGLAAVNGSAATFMTSDSAPALSQAIAPTWTAQHIFTPSSAVTAVTVNAAINAVGIQITGNTNTSNAYMMQMVSGAGSGFSSGLLLKAGTTSADFNLNCQSAAAGQFFTIYGNGEHMFVPPTTAAKQTTNLYQIGMMDIPLRSGTTPVFQDRGKFIDATGSLTIPANSSVAFPIGSTIMIYNTTAGNITIAITTDTLTWIPSNTTGTRTLAAKSLATVYKRTATTWLIWGFGLT